MQSKVRLLQHDKAFLQSNLNYLAELGQTVHQFAREAREAAAAAAEVHALEAARRQRVAAARGSLAERVATNEERGARRTELQGELGDLKVRPRWESCGGRVCLAEETRGFEPAGQTCGAGRGAGTDAGQAGRLQGRGRGVPKGKRRRCRQRSHPRSRSLQGVDVDPARLSRACGRTRVTGNALGVVQVYQSDILRGTLGWRLETGLPGSESPEMCLTFWRLFKLQVFFNRSEQDGTTAAQGYLTLVSPGARCSQLRLETAVRLGTPTADHIVLFADQAPRRTTEMRKLAARLARGPGSADTEILREFAVQDAKREPLQAIVQQLGRRLGRVVRLLHELEGLRLEFPSLNSLAVLEEGALKLSFLGMRTEALFSVTLPLGECPESPQWDAIWASEVAVAVRPCEAPRDVFCARSAHRKCWPADGADGCKTPEVTFPGTNGVTPEAITAAVGSVGGSFWHVRRICKALSALAQARQTAALQRAAAGPPCEGEAQQAATSVEDKSHANTTVTDAGQAEEVDEASLHVFSNPLFTSRTPAALRKA